MRMFPILTAIAIAGVAPPAAGQDARPLKTSPKLDAMLAGSTAGKPVSCINLPQVRGSSTVPDPDTIVYRMSSGRSYVNQPPGGCNLRGDPILVSRTPSTRLCRGDIISVVDRAARITIGSCGLGDFVPYSKPR